MSLTDIARVVAVVLALAYMIRRRWKLAQQRKVMKAGPASRRQKIVDAVLLIVAAPIAGGAFFLYAAGRYLVGGALAAVALLLWALSWRSRLRNDEAGRADDADHSLPGHALKRVDS